MMKPKEAIKWIKEQRNQYVSSDPYAISLDIAIEALERQMPKCYGIVFNQSKEPFIFEFKHNDVTSVEFVNGVWVAHRHYREDIKE